MLINFLIILSYILGRAWREIIKLLNHETTCNFDHQRVRRKYNDLEAKNRTVIFKNIN